MTREEIKYYSKRFNGLKWRLYLWKKKLLPDNNDIIECGFVGYYQDWTRFVQSQKTEIKIFNRNSFYTNKEHWVFIGITNAPRGHNFSKILVRKDIGSEFFKQAIVPGLVRCYKIRWYK